MFPRNYHKPIIRVDTLRSLLAELPDGTWLTTTLSQLIILEQRPEYFEATHAIDIGTETLEACDD